MGAAPAGAAPKKPKVTIQQQVTYLLKLAPSNFAAVRGKSSHHHDYASYELSVAAQRACGDDCDLVDNFATEKKREEWYVDAPWYYSGSPSDAQLLADGYQRLNPLLTGFKVSKGARWTQWDGPNGVYVDIELNGSLDDPGYHVFVGHKLVKPAHVVKATVLTETQKSAVQTALSSAIKLALSDGPNNFTSLRGAAEKKFLDPGKFEPYACSANFPPLTNCEITGLLDYQYAKWMFEFDVPPLGGPEDAARAYMHSVVAQVMPSTYEPATPTGVYPDDYQWNGPDRMELSYKSNYEDGKTSFKVTVWHFL